MRIASAPVARTDLAALGASAADLRRRTEAAARDAGAGGAIDAAQELDRIPRTAADLVELLPTVIESVELRSRWTPGLTLRMADLLPKPGAPSRPGGQPSTPPVPPPTTPSGKPASPTLLERLQPTLILRPGPVGREVYGGNRTWAPGGVADTRGGARLALALAGVFSVPVLLGIVIGRWSRR